MRIGILHEHPEWFLPLFGSEPRRIEHVRIDATALRWDPTERPAYDLLVNRMSPSAYLRGHGHPSSRRRVPAVRGELGRAGRQRLGAVALEISKSAQLDLFDALGMPFPRSRASTSLQALAAADRLRYPIVVRAEHRRQRRAHPAIRALGRSRCTSPAYAGPRHRRDRARAGVSSRRRRHHHRLELLDGHLLYAIRITPPASTGVPPGPTSG